MSPIAALAAVVAMRAIADCKTLPRCGDVEYSEEQWNATTMRAQAKLEKQGTHVTNLDSPDFMLVFGEVAKELGCRIPEGGEPGFGMRGAPGSASSAPHGNGR